MTHFVRASVLLLLAVGVWWVYSTRARLDGTAAAAISADALQTRLDSLPTTFDGHRFRATRIELTPEVLEESGAQAYASLQIATGEAPSMQLYVGGAVEPEVFFHPPYWCLPASGFRIVENAPVPYPALATGDETPRVNRMLVDQGRRQLLVYFWYQTDDQIADEWWASRYFRFQDLLAGVPFRPTFIVALYAEVGPSLDETEARAEDFLRLASPHLRTIMHTGDKS